MRILMRTLASSVIFQLTLCLSRATSCYAYFIKTKKEIQRYQNRYLLNLLRQSFVKPPIFNGLKHPLLFPSYIHSKTQHSQTNIKMTIELRLLSKEIIRRV